MIKEYQSLSYNIKAIEGILNSLSKINIGFINIPPKDVLKNYLNKYKNKKKKMFTKIFVNSFCTAVGIGFGLFGFNKSSNDFLKINNEKEEDIIF